MAKKRFTDVDKWRDPWFMELPPTIKLLWNYLCDACDNAGVWDVNKRLAEVQIGAAIDWLEAATLLGGRVRQIDGGRKWHLARFIEFQVGAVLNPKSPPHAFIIALLNRHGLPHVEVAHGVGNGVGTTPKERDTETEREEDSNARARATPPAAPLPLAQTKPGVMELRAIPGLKITQDSLPAWLALAEQVGLKVIEAARDELVMAGKDCWQAETATVALRLHAKARRSQVDFRAQAAQQSVASERAAVLEQTRLRQREEAIAFLNALADSGLEANADQSLLQEVRAGIASSRPGGPPIGGPFSALSKLRLWFDASKAPTPTERTA